LFDKNNIINGNFIHKQFAKNRTEEILQNCIAYGIYYQKMPFLFLLLSEYEIKSFNGSANCSSFDVVSLQSTHLSLIVWCIEKIVITYDLMPTNW